MTATPETFPLAKKAFSLRITPPIYFISPEELPKQCETFTLQCNELGIPVIQLDIPYTAKNDLTTEEEIALDKEMFANMLFSLECTLQTSFYARARKPKEGKYYFNIVNVEEKQMFSIEEANLRMLDAMLLSAWVDAEEIIKQDETYKRSFIRLIQGTAATFMARLQPLPLEDEERLDLVAIFKAMGALAGKINKRLYTVNVETVVMTEVKDVPSSDDNVPEE